MRCSLYPRSFWARCLLAMLIPLVALLLENLMTAPSLGQNPPTKHPKEEEVEDPGTAKHSGKTLRVPDSKAPEEKSQDQAPGKTASEVVDQTDSNGPASLAIAAQKATDPAEKKLYESLSHPYDRLGQRRVVPIPSFIGDSPSFQGTIEITPYLDGSGWRRGSVRKVRAREMGTVLPFEQIAMDEVGTFLRPDLAADASDDDRRSYIHKLNGAARVLDAILNWHLSAKNNGERVGDEWSKIEHQLRDRLREALLRKFRLLVVLKHFEEAYSLGTRLTEQYPKNDAVQAAFADFMVEQAQASAQHASQTQNLADWRVVAEQWRVLQRQYPTRGQVKSLGDQLAGVAQSRKEQADAVLKAGGDKAKALQLLRDAYTLWPNLPGLQEEYLQNAERYPILWVGVPQLPQYFSPATAVTDTERQAVEMMFDSLIEPTPPGSREPYTLSLARDMPRMIPLGRQFTLRDGLRWAQYGKPVVTYHNVDASNLNAVDVRNTVKLMIQSGQGGMLRQVKLSGANNNLELTLTQGYVDPLALMTFKILPWWLPALDDPDFAQHPTSSGPFVLKSRSSADVVFAANPLYQYREGMEGLPRIQEIHFFVSDDHAGDFTDKAGDGSHKMDLLLGLSTSDVKQLGSTGVVVRPMRNRRIYFLAVNHRRATLQNLAVREVIANAIDREAILNSIFRDPNSTIKYHRPLEGAYPPGSWAYTRLEDKFDRKIALAKAATIEGPVKLTLVYPDGNLDAEAACQAIADAMPKDKIELLPKAVPEHELRSKVEGSHDYDLAYYHWDFPTESYSLWPLFDPSPEATAANGSNYLGSADDTPELVDHLQRLNTSRDMKNVKNEALYIQTLIHAKLPFIPLWQLDTFIAYHRGLNLDRVSVDPIRVFNDAAHWELRKQ